jgi:hypothetical protein
LIGVCQNDGEWIFHHLMIVITFISGVLGRMKRWRVATHGAI